MFFAPLHKFPVSNCVCKAFLQFKGWFLTLTGSSNDLKGILTLQPTCSIFHLPSLCPYVLLLKLCLTLENQGSRWLAALKESSWWKRTDAVAENRFPCSQFSVITKEVYPKKANVDIWIISGHTPWKGYCYITARLSWRLTELQTFDMITNIMSRNMVESLAACPDKGCRSQKKKIIFPKGLKELHLKLKWFQFNNPHKRRWSSHWTVARKSHW